MNWLIQETLPYDIIFGFDACVCLFVVIFRMNSMSYLQLDVIHQVVESVQVDFLQTKWAKK